MSEMSEISEKYVQGIQDVENIPEINYSYKAEILNVTDGDTVLVEIDLGFDVKITRSIRLSGYDTPEIYFVESSIREKGEKAKQYLYDLLKDSGGLEDGVILQSVQYERGMYGRIIAKIWAQDNSGDEPEYTDINEHMIGYMQSNYGTAFYYNKEKG